MKTSAAHSRGISCPKRLSNRTSPAPSDATASCHYQTIGTGFPTGLFCLGQCP
jgi:hypothetical protein